MKYFFDTEFHERGGSYPIDFISIGIVAEDGREYYAVNSGMDFKAAMNHPWLARNVMGQLPPQSTWKTRLRIAQDIEDFLLDNATKNDLPELYAWFSAYDHVVLAQIFGTMMNLPSGIPMYTHDLRSMVDWLGMNPAWVPKQKSGNHDALEDARHNVKIYEALMEFKKMRFQ